MWFIYKSKFTLYLVASSFVLPGFWFESERLCDVWMCANAMPFACGCEWVWVWRQNVIIYCVTSCLTSGNDYLIIWSEWKGHIVSSRLRILFSLFFHSPQIFTSLSFSASWSTRRCIGVTNNNQIDYLVHLLCIIWTEALCPKTKMRKK